MATPAAAKFPSSPPSANWLQSKHHTDAGHCSSTNTRSFVTASITFDTGASIADGQADVVKAATFSARRVRYNNLRNPADDLSDAPPLPLNSSGTTVTYNFRPRSITLLRMNVQH